MFYKIVRIALLLLGLFCLVLFAGLGMGWFGLKNLLFAVQILLITIGVFAFYQSKPIQTKNVVLKFINLFVHFISIPVAVLAAICVKSEDFAGHYWFWINLMLVVFLGVNLITILIKSGINALPKMILSFITTVFSVLVVLQMAGKFSNGKLIMFGAAGVVLATIIAVFFGSGKKA